MLLARLLSCLVVLAFAGIARAQSVWVTKGATLLRYSTSGTLQQTIPGQYPGGYPGTEYLRASAEDADGALWLYNGTFSPYLSRIPAGGATWQHFAGGAFSTVNNGSYGGLGVYGHYIFVSDMFTFSGGETEGIVRYDSRANTTTRFGNVAVTTLNVGLDGLLYALHGTHEVRIYDPVTLALVRTTTLAGGAAMDLRGIAALADGTMITTTWDGYLRRWSRTGNLTRELLLPSGTLPSASNNLNNVVILNDGRFAVAGRFGEFFIVDAALTTFTRFAVGAVNENIFVGASPAVLGPIASAAVSAQNATYGQPFSFTAGPAVFANPNPTVLTYSASGLPAGLTLNPTTGAISGIPDQTESFTVALTATDTTGLPRGATATFALNVAKAPALVALDLLTVYYDGHPKPVAVFTTPPNLLTSVTYNGSSNVPAAVGTYTVVATVNAPNHAGTGTATLTILDSTPVITTQPVSRTVAAGETVTFNVVARSPIAPGYQWFRNGVPVAGATAATLTLADVASTHAGAYTVTVGHAGGQTTSVTASLLVTPADITGAYLSPPSSVRRLATLVRSDGSGVLLVHLVDLQAAYVAELRPDGDGAFDVAATRFGSGQGTVQRIRGRFARGEVSLTVDGVAAPLVATRAAAGAFAPGYYRGAGLGTSTWQTHAIVAPSGATLVLLLDGATTDSALDVAAAGSAFSFPTSSARRITGTINAATGQLSGAIVSEGVPLVSFLALEPARRAPGRLGNLSTRGGVDAGDNSLIAGFVLSGSAPRQVLVRAVGPGLQRFGVQSVLERPRLRIFTGNTALVDNQGWTTATDPGAIAAAASRAGAFALANDAADSAALVTLPPGNYTAVVGSASDGRGVALVEVYEIGLAETRLLNVATRGHVGTGENKLIAGLVITGNAPKRVLVRAVGPSLATFGVADFLRDPSLEVLAGATVVATNDNWNDEPRLAEAATRAGAFPLLFNNRDAALIVTLAPGDHSLVVSGVGNTTGIALVEAYELADP